MTTKTPQYLTEIENQIKRETSLKHNEEIKLMTEMLNVYLSGFNLIGSFVSSHENEIETIWLLLVIRSFHSLKSAMHLTLMGYYGSAVSVLRTVTENFFICSDCIKNPKVIEALLYERYRIPDTREGLSFRQMAIRTNNIKVYESDYKHQSEFSHPSSLSTSIIVDHEKMMINSSPVYNKILFLNCCELFFRGSIMMAEYMGNFLLYLSKEKEKSWNEKVGTTFKSISDWSNILRNQYSEDNFKV